MLKSVPGLKVTADARFRYNGNLKKTVNKKSIKKDYTNENRTDRC